MRITTTVYSTYELSRPILKLMLNYCYEYIKSLSLRYMEQSHPITPEAACTAD
jgi:hypothetical protein